MTTTTAADRLEGTLSRIHHRWLETLERILGPAIPPGAAFWDRWGAVRFLTDQFPSFYRLEATLLESLAPALPPSDAARLRQGLGEMERTRSRLVGVGRKRGTAVEVSRQATVLLTLARRWSSALEDAARLVGPADLPPGSKDLLDELASLTQVGP
jgi:hypothetical protein